MADQGIGSSRPRAGASGPLASRLWLVSEDPPPNRRDRPARSIEQGESRGEPYAVASIEIRRLAESSAGISSAVATRILNRCLLAALEDMARLGAPVTLAGTPARPVLEARFAGVSAATVAARAALAVRDAVRRAQRASENELQVSGGVATGRCRRDDRGVRVVTGSPETQATRLRERAGVGQIVLPQPALAMCEDVVDVLPAGEMSLVAGSEPVSLFAVLAVRNEPG
jgi:class 3 adenylate cyclase